MVVPQQVKHNITFKFAPERTNRSSSYLALDNMLLPSVVWNYVWHFRKLCLSPASGYVCVRACVCMFASAFCTKDEPCVLNGKMSHIQAAKREREREEGVMDRKATRREAGG